MPAPDPALLAAVGLLAAPGFHPVREDARCRYLVHEAREVPAIRAECAWPGVPPERLVALLGDWEAYAGIFSTIAEAEVLEEGPGGTRVRHRHAAPLLADRHVVLEMNREPLEAGGERFTWRRVPSAPPPGTVEVVADTGFWAVVPSPGGGSLVVTELAYDPGGWVPDGLATWFQVRGAPDFVEELREAALAGREATASR